MFFNPNEVTVGVAAHWLRGLDSNQRPFGYEPNKLPLLYPAIKDDQLHEGRPKEEGTMAGPFQEVVTPTGLEPVLLG